MVPGSAVQFSDVLDQLSFPATTFTFMPFDRRDIGIVRMETLAPDHYRPGETFLVERSTGPVPAVFPAAQGALVIVRSMVHNLALHEADEQLLYQGRRPFDPHPSG